MRAVHLTCISWHRAAPKVRNPGWIGEGWDCAMPAANHPNLDPLSSRER